MASEDDVISLVSSADLDEVVPLMSAYCEFYETERTATELRALSEALLADPDKEGLQLVARDSAGSAVAFATIFWSWSTLDAARLAIMNDLFVAPHARGRGLADRLIETCANLARERGASRLGWQTATDNLRAQTVYERVGATRSQWLDYELEL